MSNAVHDFLTDEQDALIDALLASEGIQNKEAFAETGEKEWLVNDKENRYLEFSLTDIQQGYWLGRRAGFELGAVSCYGYVEINSPHIDPQRLERAWQLVVARHDMLRARILPNGRQQVLESLPGPLVKLIDLTGMNEEEIEAQRLQIRDAMSQQVLDASQAPLFDLRLSIVTGASARLHFGIDSLICDQASLRLILRDLVTAYENPEHLAPPPAIGFRDYVLKMERNKSRPERLKARDYWLSRLDSLAPAPQLPLARPLGAIIQPSFGRVEASLSAEEWRSFQENAASSSVTPSNALAAVFVLTLKRWCRQEAMTLNLTLFDRQPLHPDMGEVVGDFTAVTLLEADASGAPDFAELCARIQDRLMQDIEHSSFSGVEVLRELAHKLGRHGEALMPVVFTSTIGLRKIENVAVRQVDGAEIPASFGEPGFTLSQTPQVALDHHLFERTGRLDINWDYCLEAFPPGLIEDMFSAYIALVRLLASNRECWQDRLEVSLPARQEERRKSYNASATSDFPQDEVLASGFVKNAEKRPASLALVDSKISLTYGEASAQAEYWARILEEKGLRRGDSIIALLPKGWQQCVIAQATAALGISYSPVDVAVPEARLAAIVRSLQAKAVLVLPGTSPSCGIPVIELPEAEKDRSLALKVRPGVKQSDIAYVIFTSGSTGTPKGVVIDHRGALTTICDVNRRFGVSYRDRVLALSAFSFDLSVYDIFGMLGAGGALVLPDADKVRDPAHWAALMREHGVTLWNTTPAMLQMLSTYLDYCPEETPAALRMAWLSGDWIPLDLFPAVRCHWPELEFISMGGATEASIWSIYYPVESILPDWSSIPYGMPLGGQEMHVLDKNLEPSPEWTPGEIYISGNGLALGYKNDAEKTAAYFITHPVTGQMFYRTGDMGRFNPAGYIEFLGREDQQVKINGFRIELGEIENALLQSPDAHKAVAVSSSAENPSASRTLVAFVSPKTGAEPEIFMPPRHSQDKVGAVWEAVRAEGHATQATSLGAYDGAWAGTWFSALEKLGLAMMNSSLAALGVLPVGTAALQPAEIMAQGGIPPRFLKLLAKWCEYLCATGWLERSPSGYRRIKAGPGQEDFHLALAEVRKLATGNKDLSALADFYEKCGAEHLRLLRGELDPLELIFPGGDWHIAHTLYEKQPIARYINSVLANTLARAVAEYGQEDLSILEISSGVGAAAASVLPLLQERKLLQGVKYTLSDQSQVFLRHSSERFKDYPAVKRMVLDPASDFAAQGIEAFSQDIIIAANALHGVADIEATLREIYDALSPGGLLVISEGFADHPIFCVGVGFLEGFTAFADDREQTGCPFHSAELWLEKLAGAGFAAANVYPEAAHPARAWGQGVITALRPAGLGRLDESKARALVARHVPDYMVPSRICALSRVPVTSNGKVDRKALAAKVRVVSESEKPGYTRPQGELELMLAEIWQEGLGLKDVSSTASFFTLGGDSLFAVQMNSRISSVFEVSLPLTEILRKPTISDIAKLVESAICEDLKALEAN